jgi:hypothetical protein
MEHSAICPGYFYKKLLAPQNGHSHGFCKDSCSDSECVYKSGRSPELGSHATEGTVGKCCFQKMQPEVWDPALYVFSDFSLRASHLLCDMIRLEKSLPRESWGIT